MYKNRFFSIVMLFIMLIGMMSTSLPAYAGNNGHKAHHSRSAHKSDHKGKKTSHKDAKDIKKNDSKKNDVNAQVIDGWDAHPGQYPFFVALSSSRADVNTSEFCTGFLLSADHVGTARHCVKGKNPQDIWITIGTVDLKQPVEIRRGTQIHVNSSKGGDMGIVTLDQPVDVSLYPPILLPQTRDSQPAAGTQLIVGGWGNLQTKGALYPSILQVARVPVMSDKKAKSAYSKEKKKKHGKHGHKKHNKSAFDPRTMIAAGNGTGDTCDGDSGGPAFTESGGIYVLRGVTSWGYNCNSKKHPGVYADVVPMLSWIHSIIG